MAAFSFDFKEYPKKVNLAILFLCLGWALHYYFYFSYLGAQDSPKTLYLQLGVGIGICVLVAAIKQWARMMCIFFNIGMVAMYALLALNYHSLEKRTEAVLTALVVVCFILATYWLLTPAVRRFFRERNQPPEPDTTPLPPPGDFTTGRKKKRNGNK